MADFGGEHLGPRNRNGYPWIPVGENGKYKIEPMVSTTDTKKWIRKYEYRIDEAKKPIESGPSVFERRMQVIDGYLEDFFRSTIREHVEIELRQYVLHQLFKGLEPAGEEEKLILGNQILKLVGLSEDKHADEVQTYLTSYLRRDNGESEMAIAAIARLQEPTEDETQKKRLHLLGRMVERTDFPTQLKALLRAFNTEVEGSQAKKALNGLIFEITGVDAEKLKKDMVEFYDQVNFKNYALNIQTEIQRREMFKELEQRGELVMSEGKASLDVACGTGWLMKMEKEMGMSRVCGIDITPAHVEETNRIAGVEAKVMDWKKLEYADEEFDLVTCLGRSLPHAENENDFMAVIKELTRVTKMGGHLIIDMPDPNRGHYKAGLETIAKGIEKILPGFEGEFAAKRNLIIVDSPDGVHFSNRFLYDIAGLKKWMEHSGFEVEVRDEPILKPDGEKTGDHNMVFVCKKVRPPWNGVEISR